MMQSTSTENIPEKDTASEITAPAVVDLNRLPEGARDLSRPLHERIEALIAAFTLDEKVSQMLHGARAIERLGIPAYNWWNEGSHGVARAGRATVFPHAIGLAASWNIDLLTAVGEAVSDEARAKHHDFTRRGEVIMYGGLTFWTPNINIVRDPRWGRAQETFGEDPFLTARLAVAYIRALQGDDPQYLKVSACAKHYAVHSGPEALRHEFNAEADSYDLWDTYLPAFRACVQEAGVDAIMGAYTRTNGEACCASPTLLGHILRGLWNFGGHVVSDCGAIEDIALNHRLAPTEAAASAMAVKAGCDLCCGGAYIHLTEAVERGLLTEVDLDTALRHLFTTRFKLGMFDPPERVPYTQIPIHVVGSAEHQTLARRAAQEAIVLLKNDGGLLPLSRTDGRVKSITVIGPNAHDMAAQIGNYAGTPAAPTTILEGIQQAAGSSMQVEYVRGCDVVRDGEDEFARAIAAATRSDVVIFVGGLSQVLEGEDLQDEGLPEGMTSQGDRVAIELPPVQERLLHALHATGKPVVLVLVGGSAIAIPWAAEHLPAILLAWYPGERGEGVADVLFGDANPAGRLPVTMVRATADLPPFPSYDMRGRTYRYFEGEPLYRFGHGLSYTTFAYTNLQWKGETLSQEDTTVQIDLTNTGARAGDEVVQLYVEFPQTAGQRSPKHALRGFRRVSLQPGETRTVTFTLRHDDFAVVEEGGTDGAMRVLPSAYGLFVGGGQPGYATGLSATIREVG